MTAKSRPTSIPLRTGRLLIALTVACAGTFVALLAAGAWVDSVAAARAVEVVAEARPRGRIAYAEGRETPDWRVRLTWSVSSADARIPASVASTESEDAFALRMLESLGARTRGHQVLASTSAIGPGERWILRGLSVLIEDPGSQLEVLQLVVTRELAADTLACRVLRGAGLHGPLLLESIEAEGPNRFRLELAPAAAEDARRWLDERGAERFLELR